MRALLQEVSHSQALDQEVAKQEKEQVMRFTLNEEGKQQFNRQMYRLAWFCVIVWTILATYATIKNRMGE